MNDTPMMDPTKLNRPDPQGGGSNPSNNMMDPTKLLRPTAAQLSGGQDEIMLDLRAESENYDRKAKKTINISSPQDLYKAVDNWMVNVSKVQLQEKLIFFELLGATINAGVSVTEALRMIESQSKSPKLRFVIRDLRLLIEDGSSLAGAFRKNNDVFDEATCAIIEAGEKSGKLNEVLRELIKQYERMSNIKKKVMGVMMYPIIVAVVIVILIVVVLIFVVPKLIDIFGSVQNLPLPTQILKVGSDLMLQQWPLLLVGTIAVSFGFGFWKKSYAGARQIATIVFYIPIIGMLLRDMILSRVTRIFGFLMASGVPIMESLKITANVARHPLYEDRLFLAIQDMEKGISLGENLADNERLFPSMLVNMITIGEKTASLETIMGKIADFYDDELDRKVNNLSKLMEPIILFVIAFIAVFMILAIYLPITQLNDQFIESS